MSLESGEAVIIEAHGKLFALVANKRDAKLAARKGYAPLLEHEVEKLKRATGGKQLDSDIVRAVVEAKRHFSDSDITEAIGLLPAERAVDWEEMAKRWEDKPPLNPAEEIRKIINKITENK